MANSTQLDLNAMRAMVAGGMTIGDAFFNLLQARVGATYISALTKPELDAAGNPVLDGAGNPVTYTAGVKVRSADRGPAYNNSASHQITATHGDLRHYSINFNTYLADAGTQTKIAEAGGLLEYLNGKGFRAYCASDPGQWFNFQFYDPSEVDPDRPASGTANFDIKTIMIDITNVTDAKSLVEEIVTQSTPLLTGADPSLNHYMRTAIDGDGVLYLYDWRTYNLHTPTYMWQERGAKIGDHVLDNVIKDVRHIRAEKLIIHHTDKASKNIVVTLPRTSIDHVLGYKKEDKTIHDYSIMTSDMREKLLGGIKDAKGKVEKGILDSALQYLSDANTIIGAQINHMQSADANIITAHENTTNSVSVIRDADMAKAMIEFTKNNVLSQAAQSMLAQANQNSSNVLSLLQ